MVPGDRGYWMLHEFQLVEKKPLRHFLLSSWWTGKGYHPLWGIYIYIYIYETAICKAHSECPIPLLRCMSCGRQLVVIIQSSPTCDFCIVDLSSGISMFVIDHRQMAAYVYIIILMTASCVFQLQSDCCKSFILPTFGICLSWFLQEIPGHANQLIYLILLLFRCLLKWWYAQTI